jgi:hypothetical protein
MELPVEGAGKAQQTEYEHYFPNRIVEHHPKDLDLPHTITCNRLGSSSSAATPGYGRLIDLGFMSAWSHTSWLRSLTQMATVR